MLEYEYDLTLKLNYISSAVKVGMTELVVPQNWNSDFIKLLKTFGFRFYKKLNDSSYEVNLYIDLTYILPEGSLNYTFTNLYEQKSDRDLLEYLSVGNGDLVKVKYSNPKIITKAWKEPNN